MTPFPHFVAPTAFAAVALMSLTMLPRVASALDTSAGPVAVTRMAGGLEEPWSLAFLPDGRFLVTERDGRLTAYLPRGGGQGTRIDGLPPVFAEGQGGLFDVLVPRDFAKTSELLFSFARPLPDGSGAGTAIWSARLDGTTLVDGKLLWAMREASPSAIHFGGRLVEGRDGKVYLTVGERGMGMPAQDLSSDMGKIIRLNRDGTVPADNPFPDGSAPEIWSSGHRNPQGATLDAEGHLWVNSHAAQGGDEVNRIVRGLNYGWPVITYGINYNGARIGEGTAKAGMEQPVHYWDPSIAPSGHVIYSGKLWPAWKGDHFIGSLKFDYISRLDPDTPANLPGVGGWAEERIASAETGRVRDVREAPDGSIWFLSVNMGAVYRIAPE